MTKNNTAPSLTPLRFLPEWLRGFWGMMGIATGIYLILYLAWIYFHWGGRENITLVSDLTSLPLDLLAVLAAGRVALDKQFDRHEGIRGTSV